MNYDPAPAFKMAGELEELLNLPVETIGVLRDELVVPVSAMQKLLACRALLGDKFDTLD